MFMFGIRTVKEGELALHMQTNLIRNIYGHKSNKFLQIMRWLQKYLSV